MAEMTGDLNIPASIAGCLETFTCSRALTVDKRWMVLCVEWSQLDGTRGQRIGPFYWNEKATNSFPGKVVWTEIFSVEAFAPTPKPPPVIPVVCEMLFTQPIVDETDIAAHLRVIGGGTFPIPVAELPPLYVPAGTMPVNPGITNGFVRTNAPWSNERGAPSWW